MSPQPVPGPTALAKGRLVQLIKKASPGTGEVSTNMFLALVRKVGSEFPALGMRHVVREMGLEVNLMEHDQTLTVRDPKNANVWYANVHQVEELFNTLMTMETI